MSSRRGDTRDCARRQTYELAGDGDVEACRGVRIARLSAAFDLTCESCAVATESALSLPIIDHARALRRPVARRSARPAAAVPHAGADHLLPRPAADRRRPHAVRVGRDGQAVSRRLRRASSRSASGHCHPTIVEKVREQVGKLQHTTTIYLHPTIGQFGKKLVEKLPAGHRRGRTSPTAAARRTRSAILAAREFTGSQDVIALRNGYHGGTQAPMGLTAHGTWKFKTQPDDTTSSTRRPATATAARSGWSIRSCDLKCAHDVKNVIQYETPRRDRLLHRRADSGRRRRRHAAATEYLQDRLRHRPPARRPVHRRRSAGRLRPHGRITTGRFRTGA